MFHFTDPAFADAANRPGADLEKPLAAMLTRFGFTTVVDTGSDIANTSALRERIEKGDLKGPAILTAGIPLYPKNGLPIYLHHLPPELLAMLSQPATPRLREAVRSNGGLPTLRVVQWPRLTSVEAWSWRIQRIPKACGMQ